MMMESIQMAILVAEGPGGINFNPTPPPGKFGMDVQTVSGNSYSPTVWVNPDPGSPEQPTLRGVGGGFANPPAEGTNVTVDGFQSKMYRQNTIQMNNACANFGGPSFCRLSAINLYSSLNGGQVVQGGDSGGPVFCYECYPNVVTPAGLIEGIMTGTSNPMAFFTFIGDDQAYTNTGISISG